jgi:DNA gyrase subunit A
MGEYAEEVNLSRSVPDLFDGLKPVQRRILYEAFLQRGGFRKTARIVGGVIGRWHPHGDASVDSAIETLVHHPTPTMLGSGNWGGLIDGAAAMRYTNCKLSNYGESFFGTEYFNKKVTSFVPNYDGEELEPVSLPSMLPNVLLNGGEGIGVGTTTMLPTFTPESVIAMLKRILSGEQLEPRDYARTLKYSSKWGGKLSNTPDNKKAYMGLFRGASASVQFEAELIIDRDNKAIEIDDWPPGLNPVKFIAKVRTLTGVDQAYNHKGDTGFRIEIERGYNYTQFDKVVEQVQRLAKTRRSFKINVTHRKAKTEDGKTTFDTKFLSVSIPKLMYLWLKERLLLEKRSLEFRMEKQAAAIAYSKLLIYACTKLDIVFAALKSANPKVHLVKGLKITEAQADQILDLKVRQLSKLDKEAMQKTLKDQEEFMRCLKQWYAKPREKVASDFDLCLTALAKDRKYENTKDEELSVA